ncbi:MAG: PilZ domain-containing protein, partial [Thermoanaerobaculia bacterium]
MYEAATRNLRTAERFLIEPPLSGQFLGSAALVIDISVKGARFRHAHPLEMGQKGVLQMTIDGRPSPAFLEAVVVWTKPDPFAPGRYVSGVRTYADAELIDPLLAHLQTAKRTTRIAEL